MTQKNSNKQTKSKNSKGELSEAPKNEKLIEFFENKNIPLVYKLVFLRSLTERCKVPLKTGSWMLETKNALANEAKLLRLELG